MAFGEAIQGAAGGAGLGSMFGPVGSIVGGAVGFLSGIFGDSAETKRKKRVEQGMQYLKEARRNTITTGMDRLGALIAKNKMSAELGAGRRALASGNADAAESMIAPVAARADAAGGEAVNQFMDQTTKQYNQAELSLQMEGLNAPLDPSPTDYLLEAGKGALTYKLNKDYTDTLAKMGPNANMGGETIVTSGISPVKVETARDPVISGEFAMTGANPPANTLGMGSFRTPEARAPVSKFRRPFGNGNIYPVN